MGVPRETPARLLLPLLALTLFLMTVDTSVMNVSITALVRDLDTTVTAIQGVITAYTLVMAAGMISGGRISGLIGRRRALRLGLVIYAIGSGVTAIAPNTVVLLIGWSLLEGIGAALIMPTVTALIANEFHGRARASAYGTTAAAAAIAVAVGPIVGGFVTAYASWRLVFAAEVLLALGLLAGTRIVREVARARDAEFDIVGAVVSAGGIALLVFGVLQSATWGWITPRVASGDAATPSLFGISAVTWMIIAGGCTLLAFIEWQRARVRRGRQPLLSPSLLEIVQLRVGLGILLMQALILAGTFFTMPLFLSVVLGLDAFATGLRLLPLSVVLVVVAPTVPRLLPQASPRRLVQCGLLLILAATLVLAARFEVGAEASITFVPFVLLGAGIGLIASQIGNVIVSSAGTERASEIGGLQYTAQNIGSSLGTALIGSILIAALGPLILQGIQSSSKLDAAIKAAAPTTVSTGVSFLSDPQMRKALASTSLSDTEQAEILRINDVARYGAMRRAMVILSLLVLVALLLSTRLPTRQPGEGPVAVRGP